jgi:tRNA pseudouridine55 synthase
MNLEDDNKTVTFTVNCSKGTYIRTLCEDVGKKLGCGACMMKLTRTRVGRFSIDESLTLGQISALVLQGGIEEKVIAVDEMFPDYRKVTVKESYNKLIYNGNKFTQEALVLTEDIEFMDTEQFRVYDELQEFVGIYRYDGGIFVPVKMFYTGNYSEATE